MNYWDQSLKKLVEEARGFLNLDEEALWDVYKQPYQIVLDEERWRFVSIVNDLVRIARET